VAKNGADAAAGRGKQQLCAFPQTQAQDAVLQIAPRLGYRHYPELLGHGTKSQAGHLWEDKPKPVGFLPTGCQLAPDFIVNRILGLHELSQLCICRHIDQQPVW